VYLKYYGSALPPFEITLNPRFLFLAANYLEGLKHPLSGILVMVNAISDKSLRAGFVGHCDRGTYQLAGCTIREPEGKCPA
jgi:hypothetical protein